MRLEVLEAAASATCRSTSGELRRCAYASRKGWRTLRIDKEFHPAVRAGFAAIEAAQARQARLSSSSTYGESRTISSSLRPEAGLENVGHAHPGPGIAGRPPRIAGSMAMRGWPLIVMALRNVAFAPLSR
jgi:hypothetical protein